MKRFILPINDGIHFKVKVCAAEHKVSMQAYIVSAVLERLHQDQLKKEKSNENKL